LLPRRGDPSGSLEAKTGQLRSRSPQIRPMSDGVWNPVARIPVTHGFPGVLNLVIWSIRTLAFVFSPYGPASWRSRGGPLLASETCWRRAAAMSRTDGESVRRDVMLAGVHDSPAHARAITAAAAA
jgi:hypothetical protein